MSRHADLFLPSWYLHQDSSFVLRQACLLKYILFFLQAPLRLLILLLAAKELHNDDNYLAFLWYFHVMSVFCELNMEINGNATIPRDFRATVSGR